MKTDDPPVHPRPLLLFAPGAGAPSTSAWMTRWAERLGALGEVVRFDYPYMKAGRRSPDRLPALVAAHRAALEEARGGRRDRLAVLVGKSMGGRVGCHLSLEEPVAGLVCLGYPLVGQRGDVRSEVLLALRTPVLFVQGGRDRLCPLDRLEEVRARMSAPSALHVVEGGDHSLEVGVRALAARGARQEDLDRASLGAIAAFLAGL
jgi:predicted alpha/beta-hydrolase family hydrolase